MRLILSFVLAFAVFASSMPARANDFDIDRILRQQKQYLQKEKRNREALADAEAKVVRYCTRSDPYRNPYDCQSAQIDLDRARLKTAGVTGNSGWGGGWNSPRRHKSRDRNDGVDAVLGVFGLAAGMAIGGAIANQGQRQYQPRQLPGPSERIYMCGGNVKTNCMEGSVD